MERLFGEATTPGGVVMIRHRSSRKLGPIGLRWLSAVVLGVGFLTTAGADTPQPLLRAILTDDAEKAREILEADPATAQATMAQMPALWMAALYGRLEIVELLLAHGATPGDPPGASPAGSALHMVAMGARKEADFPGGFEPTRDPGVRVATALLKNGADSSARSASGKTALDVALEHERREIARLLVEAEGVDVTRGIVTAIDASGIRSFRQADTLILHGAACRAPELLDWLTNAHDMRRLMAGEPPRIRERCTRTQQSTFSKSPGALAVTVVSDTGLDESRQQAILLEDARFNTVAGDIWIETRSNPGIDLFSIPVSLELLHEARNRFQETGTENLAGREVRHLRIEGRAAERLIDWEAGFGEPLKVKIKQARIDLWRDSSGLLWKIGLAIEGRGFDPDQPRAMGRVEQVEEILAVNEDTRIEPPSSALFWPGAAIYEHDGSMFRVNVALKPDSARTLVTDGLLAQGFELVPQTDGVQFVRGETRVVVTVERATSLWSRASEGPRYKSLFTLDPDAPMISEGGSTVTITIAPEPLGEGPTEQ